MPKVSVVMPAYNAEKYISEAIDSILNQTFTDFEFIIIDDGSIDNTIGIINNYNDERIRLIQNEANLGVAQTLNKGIELSRGQYIARMDADDIAFPSRIEKQVLLLDRDKRLGICGSNAILFGSVNPSVTNIPLTDSIIRYSMFLNSPFIHPSVCMRTEMLKELGVFYESEFEGREDYRLWMKISLSDWQMKNISQPLIKYRIHSNQVTQKKSVDYVTENIKLKKAYFESLGFSFSDDTINVICSVSLGNPCKSIEQFNLLYNAFEIIVDNKKRNMPVPFQNIIISELLKLKVSINEAKRYTSKISLTRKTVFYVRRILF